MATIIKKINQKIQERKSKENPIEYSNTVVGRDGKLEKRESLLDKRIVEGYALIWGTVNSHGERFVKGCCSKAINDLGPGSNSSYQLKFRDEHGRVCGLFEELIEDEIGLYFRTVELDDVPWSNNLLVQLKSKSINNFSIGFNYCWDKVEWDDSMDCLVCLEIFLMEISAVAIPSEMQTYAIRAIEEIEYVNEDVLDFISLLPRSKQLEAKKLFTRCLSLRNNEQYLKIIDTLKEEAGKKSKTNKTSIRKQLLKKLKDD